MTSYPVSPATALVRRAGADHGAPDPAPRSTYRITHEAWRVDWSKFNEQALGPGSHVLPGVREIIHGWLERITTPANELLTAAVLGQTASFDYLCRVAGLVLSGNSPQLPRG